MKIKILSLLLGSVLVFCGFTGNKSTDGGKTKDPALQSKVQENKMMIIAKLLVKPENVKDFTTAAKEIIELSNKESGCNFYQLYQDPYENTKFVFVEEYKNQAAVDAHFATDYFKGFGQKIGNYLVKPAEIKIITVAGESIK